MFTYAETGQKQAGENCVQKKKSKATSTDSLDGAVLTFRNFSGFSSRSLIEHNNQGKTAQLQGFTFVSINNNKTIQKMEDNELLKEELEMIEDAFPVISFGLLRQRHIIKIIARDYYEHNLPKLKDKITDLKSDFLITHMKSIADDEKNYPYSGFLTMGLKPRTAVDAKLFKGTDYRGMNCWGSIILAAKNAGLILDSDLVKMDGKSDKKFKYQSEAPLGQNEFILIGLLKKAELIQFNDNTEVPKGYIISKGSTAIDHVVLSLGEGKGDLIKVVHVNAENSSSKVARGTTTLSDAFITIPDKIFVSKPPWL